MSLSDMMREITKEEFHFINETDGNYLLIAFINLKTVGSLTTPIK
jgi:hypothetical protein